MVFGQDKGKGRRGGEMAVEVDGIAIRETDLVVRFGGRLWGQGKSKDVKRVVRTAKRGKDYASLGRNAVSTAAVRGGGGNG